MLSDRMPPLPALEVLAAISAAGSINAAARALGRSQQAVSMRVQALEAQTALHLVARGTHGSQLTVEGTVVADWAARLLDVAAEVDAGLAALRGDRRTHLDVAASLTIAERLLPRWLVALGSQVNVRLTAVNSTEVVRLVVADHAEVGFVEGPTAPRRVRSRVIAHDELTIVVAPSHPWARRTTPIGATELAATPLASRERGSGTRLVLEQQLRAVLGPNVDIALPTVELSTTAAVRTAVQAGAGPAVLSTLLVADDLAAGRLRAVPTEDLTLRRSLRAVWRDGRNPPAGPARDLVTISAGR